MPIRGSCHCGKIAYTLDAVPTEAIECNCSICRRKGAVLAAFPPDKFHLETARDDIAVYTFGRHAMRHQFCRTCGCAPFAEETGPDGEVMAVVNLRCAEDLDLSTLRITQFRRGEPLGLRRSNTRPSWGWVHRCTKQCRRSRHSCGSTTRPKRP